MLNVITLRMQYLQMQARKERELILIKIMALSLRPYFEWVNRTLSQRINPPTTKTLRVRAMR